MSGKLSLKLDFSIFCFVEVILLNLLKEGFVKEF